jgi:hypothetical protein
VRQSVGVAVVGPIGNDDVGLGVEVAVAVPASLVQEETIGSIDAPSAATLLRRRNSRRSTGAS